MKKRTVFILVNTFVICCILAFIEHGLEINYLIKTGFKISLFIVSVLIYIKLFKNFRFRDVLSVKKITNREWIRIILLGLSSALIILVAYLICLPYIALDQVMNDLTERLGITATTYIIVGVYITFGNSFLEEFFFRGFIFFNLPRKLAYLFSPLLFAAYHIPMIMLWFSPLIIVICFIGLWLIGVIFHLVNEKNGTIWASWIIHICADVMIILIGLTLFY